MFKKTTKKQNNQPSGFTLLELVVGMGIFVLVLTSIIGIFQQVIRVERKAVNAQNAQENVRYVMEVISKEIRTAERSFGDCADVLVGDIFAVADGALYMQNQYGECVAYWLDNNRLKIARDGEEYYVTGDETVIEYLNFIITTAAQPAVTITLGLSTLDASELGVSIPVQTTVSSRYYLEDDIL